MHIYIHAYTHNQKKILLAYISVNISQLFYHIHIAKRYTTTERRKVCYKFTYATNVLWVVARCVREFAVIAVELRTEAGQLICTALP